MSSYIIAPLVLLIVIVIWYIYFEEYVAWRDRRKIEEDRKQSED